MRTPWSPLVGLLGLAFLATGSAPLAQDKPPVVSVSLPLVQVDACGSEVKARHVDDLGCHEFEIYEDRRKQTITNCSFVRTSESPAAPDVPAPESGPAPPRTAPRTPPIRREDVRRTI